jgi:hypothetical protein
MANIQTSVVNMVALSNKGQDVLRTTDRLLSFHYNFNISQVGTNVDM